MKGIIKTLNSDKAFGFISAGGKDYFFHRSGFNGHWEDLVEDFVSNYKIQVEFEAVTTPKGPRAENVRRLDHPNQAS